MFAFKERQDVVVDGAFVGYLYLSDEIENRATGKPWVARAVTEYDAVTACPIYCSKTLFASKAEAEGFLLEIAGIRK